MIRVKHVDRLRRRMRHKKRPLIRDEVVDAGLQKVMWRYVRMPTPYLWYAPPRV
jgi:hypothetical protein